MARAAKTTTVGKKKTSPAEPALASADHSIPSAPAKKTSRKKPKLRTNLLSHSEQFNTAPWMVARAKLLANAATAPDGKLTASQLIEGTQLGPHHCYSKYPFLAGTQYTLSVFVKAAERTKGVIQLGNGAIAFPKPCTCTFDLLNKAAAKSAEADAATIKDLDNGWFRVSVTATAVTTASDAVFALFLSNGVRANYTGDGKSSLCFWGAQLETGPAPTDYQPTSDQ